MNNEIAPITVTAQIARPVDLSEQVLKSGFRRPDGTPAGSVNELTREYLAWPPLIAVRALNQCAIRTVLLCGRIGPHGWINGGGIMDILQ